MREDAWRCLWLTLLVLVDSIGGFPYYEPKFSPCASWGANATTFAGSNRVGTNPQDVFVADSNIVYVATPSLNRVQAWHEVNMTVVSNLSSGSNSPYATFVANSGDIYVDVGIVSGRVDKWASSGTNKTTAMVVPGGCYGLLLDHNNTLYCSLGDRFRVVKKLSNASANSTINAAGTGSIGSAPNMLNMPRGILVDFNFNLYVTDCGNDRVQVFALGKLNATTVVGAGANGTILLDCPLGLAFDADEYLFIVDCYNNRIVGSGPRGFRCIAGCAGGPGSTADKFNHPRMLRFDVHGNIFVVDAYNNRIQKFLLQTNSCSETSSTALQLITPVTNWHTSTSNARSSERETGPQTSVPMIDTLYGSSMSSSLHSNTTSTLCQILQPCQNHRSCVDNNTAAHGFTCSCLPGFGGTYCQLDHRLCQPRTCSNRGICNETSLTTFVCSCSAHWYGIHCQIPINYCENVTCQNKGVCRSLLANYTCECLSGSYSGQYCEISSSALVLRQTICKSLGYIAIVAISSLAIFVVVMDMLKYCFGINPTGRKLRRTRRTVKKCKHPVAIRFIYINAIPSLGL